MWAIDKAAHDTSTTQFLLFERYPKPVYFFFFYQYRSESGVGANGTINIVEVPQTDNMFMC